MIGAFDNGKKPGMHNPLVLAYLGDAVYEVYIRSYLVAMGSNSVKDLHKKAKQFVSASAQSDIFARIENMLNEEEIAIYKRGRNSHSASSPKNADIVDYRRATGFEALIGYLYLKGDEERLGEIIGVVVSEKK